MKCYFKTRALNFLLPAAAGRLEPLVEEGAGDGLARGPRDDAPQQVVLGGADDIVGLFVLLNNFKCPRFKSSFPQSSLFLAFLKFKLWYSYSMAVPSISEICLKTVRSLS